MTTTDIDADRTDMAASASETLIAQAEIIARIAKRDPVTAANVL